MSPKPLSWTTMVQSIIRNASLSVQSLNMDDLFGATMMNLPFSLLIMASDTKPCNFSSFTSSTITLINASYLILLYAFKFIFFSFTTCVWECVVIKKREKIYLLYDSFCKVRKWIWRMKRKFCEGKKEKKHSNKSCVGVEEISPDEQVQEDWFLRMKSWRRQGY